MSVIKNLFMDFLESEDYKECPRRDKCDCHIKDGSYCEAWEEYHANPSHWKPYWQEMLSKNGRTDI